MMDERTLFRIRMATLARYELTEQEATTVIPMIQEGMADYLLDQVYICGEDLRSIV